VVEDAGDTLDGQRNALDSGSLFDTQVDYGSGAQPIRFLAEGRDASATLDTLLAGSSGFQNEGDNEITGIHVSDGERRSMDSSAPGSRSLPVRLACVLHAAARRQQHLGDRALAGQSSEPGEAAVTLGSKGRHRDTQA
jgi:hypothetical protein